MPPIANKVHGVLLAAGIMFIEAALVGFVFHQYLFHPCPDTYTVKKKPPVSNLTQFSPSINVNPISVYIYSLIVGIITMTGDKTTHKDAASNVSE